MQKIFSVLIFVNNNFFNFDLKKMALYLCDYNIMPIFVA